jgi:chromosomal replication initiator protein
MLDTLWAQILSDLETRISQATLDSWLRPCRLASLDGDVLHIAAPNKFIQNWLAQNHARLLEAAAARILGGEPRVVLQVDSGLAEEPPPPRPAPGPSLATGLSPRYTFESFVVGNSNQFAQAACQAVAQLPSKAYNPLFIYGGVGLGKTHLLHAVGHEIARKFPSMRLLYISTERFTNELINAIRFDRTPEFRAKYRTIDLLLIDDIQFISGKERTQEEFFHTFNDLYDARKQIVISSDAPPK